MKKHLSLIIALVFSITTLWAQTWIGLTDTVPAQPQITLTASNSQQVSFTVELPGFYATTTTEKGVAYQRLSIPGHGTAGEVGAPEMPVITQRIAIPKCSGINYSVQITTSQTLQDYRVYPVPDWQIDGKGKPEQVFTLNPVAYQTNAFTPVESYAVLENGALRNQHFVQLELHPLLFNPVTGQLQVATEMSITLSFVNPITNVNVNTGIFNNVATHTFLNYQDYGIKASVNDKAFEKAGFTQGSVDWMRLEYAAQVNNIVADYLIICADPFFPANNPPNEEILRLAHHRAIYNGFDVMILNVEDILSDLVGFYYETPNASPALKNFQRIRTCIRMIYEGQNAQHTYDGHLGYVLLVGDVDAGNTGMPSSKASKGHDYFFSCVTRDGNGVYDDVGDLYIGRFCVPNNILPNDGLQKLYNMVEKTIFFESEASFGGWRNKVLSGNGNPPPSELYYSWLQNEYLPSVLHTQNLEVVNYYDGYQQQPEEVFRQAVLDLFNQGAPYLGFHTHGYPDAWNMGLTADYILPRLNNTYKTPFCVSAACFVGQMDMLCLAERLTHSFSDKGFVAMVASSEPVPYNAPEEDEQNATQRGLMGNLDVAALFPKAIYQNLSHIVGEAFLESYLQLVPNYGKAAFNIFGDPALNIMADGFEITRDVTVEQFTDISSRVRVRNGATLTIPNNCTFTFHGNGKLIIEEDGHLVIGNGAQIIGVNNNITHAIHVKSGGFTVGKNATFENLSGGILLEKAGGGASYDNHKTYTISHSTFNNTPLKHRGTRLHVSNCTFNVGSDVLTSVSVSYIDSCYFNQTSFEYDSRVLPWQDAKYPATSVRNSNFIGHESPTIALQLSRLRGFRLVNNTIFGYETGISLHSSGHTLSDAPVVAPTTIKNNKISYCGTGIEVYNSVAEFTGNRIDSCYLGVGLYNNSYTSFGTMLEPNPSDYQIISDCYSIELYASATSFPTFFRYNQIIDDNNLGNTYQDPLIWWDVKNTHLLLRPVVTYNCWSDNFYPPVDLYPQNIYIWDPVWDCEGGKSGAPIKGDDEILYLAGLDFFAEEDYTNAELAFKEIIEIYPKSRFAIAALHELFALEHYTHQDFFSLNTYFASFTDEESVLFNTAEFLATRCYVKEREWQPAVDWYEDRIMNPPSYQDSVFAVIDLGYIHLLMEADTMGGAKSGSVRYRLEEIKPKTKQHYEENKTALLATLPQIKKSKNDKFIQNNDINIPKIEKKGIIGLCTPNPITGATTIDYEIYTKGRIEIRIYNNMGQIVKNLPLGTQIEGNYQTKVTLSDLSMGIYHYVLFLNGERVDSKKLVVN